MSKPSTRDRPPGLITTPVPGPSAGDTHSPFWQGSSSGSLTCPPMAPSRGFSQQALPPPRPRLLLLPKDQRWGRAVRPGTGARSLRPPGAALANGRGGPPHKPRPPGRRLGPRAWGLDLGGRAWSLVGPAAAPAASRLCGWNRAVDTSQGKDGPRSVEAAEPTLRQFSGVKAVLTTPSGFFRGPEIFRGPCCRC